MTTFYSFLDQISTTAAPTSRSASISTPTHHNPHATPTLVDVARLLRLVQEQMETLATTAPSPENLAFLTQLVTALEGDILDPPEDVRGVAQEFLDGLERVSRKKLGEESCPICAERFLDDQYCLVVELPCHPSHKYDLECVGPWLQSKGCCPLCREDFTKKKAVVVEDDEEDDDPMGMYS